MQEPQFPDLKGMTLNKRVAVVRKAMGFSQKEIAEQFSIKHSTYAQMERRGNITCKFLKRFCDFLKIDIHLLIYGELPPERPIIVELPPEKQPEQNSELKLTPRERNMVRLVRSFKNNKREEFYKYLEEFRYT